MPPPLVVDEEGRLDIGSFYSPFAKQNQLHTSSAHNLLGVGGNGSGKSSVLLGEAIYTMSEFPGADCLLLRRDFPELEKGLILDFKNLVPRELYHYNDSKHIVTWKINGSHLFFGHLRNGSEKDLSQYLSSAFPLIGVDELGQFSYAAWSFLTSRNRVNRGCGPNAAGLMPIPKMMGATNPLGPGWGWIKRLWVEKKPVSEMRETFRKPDGKYYQNVQGLDVCVYDPHDHVYVHSTVLDNPAQLEKDPQYIDKLRKLPPPLRKKALEGDLHSQAGSYFANFTQERCVRSLPRDREQIVFEKWQPIWLGWDWGLAHHSAVYWNTRVKFLGLSGAWKSVVLTYRELMVNEMDYQEARARGEMRDDWSYKRWLCEEIKRRTPTTDDEKKKGEIEDELSRLKFIFFSPERFNRVDDTSHTVAGEISQINRQIGLPPVSEAIDAREDGAVMLYNMIDAQDWIILDACPNLIRSIETRIRDEGKREDVLKTDDELDDCYDGGRYGLVSMLREKRKPEEVKLAEKLQSIEDPTSRMLYAFQNRIDQRTKGQPVKPKIVPRWMNPKP